MNEIDKKILNHICIDYKYNPIYDTTSQHIFEEVGYIPEIDKYINGFQEFIREKIFPFIKDGGTYAARIKSPSVFGVDNPFFTGCDIDIIASIRDGQIAWGSHYDQEKSFYNEQCKYVVIKITAGASNGKQLMSVLSSNFAHELTHAYDDYRATINGGTSIENAAKQSGYQYRTLTWELGNTKNVKMLGKALYVLSPMELNAIIGQIKGEIHALKTSTPQEALEAIKKTIAYKCYQWLKSTIEAINNTDNSLIKNELLHAYTVWIGYNKNKNKFPGSNYVVRKNLTYEGFLTELNSMFRKWERKFLTMVGKIAYKHHVDTSLPLINYSDPDEEVSNKKYELNEGFEKERTFTYGVDAYPVDNEKN